MNTTAPRIVLDTNILIASIGKKSPFRWIFDCVIEGRIHVLTLVEFEQHYIDEMKESD